jgi:hypothetical protein
MWKRVIVVAALAAVAMLPGLPAQASNYQEGYDSSYYHGSRSELHFRLSNDGGGRLTAWVVEAMVDLPLAYANAFCAYAVVNVNGRSRTWDGRRCDTNGDAHLDWFFPDLHLKRGDVVTVWFSDPFTRYRLSHPEIHV